MLCQLENSKQWMVYCLFQLDCARAVFLHNRAPKSSYTLRFILDFVTLIWNLRGLFASQDQQQTDRSKQHFRLLLTVTAAKLKNE